MKMFLKKVYKAAVNKKTVISMTIVLALILIITCTFVSAFREKQVPLDEGLDYHVIVAGGEPEGVAAALAAARNGMKTLLVERGDCLGGLITLGMLNFIDKYEGPNRAEIVGGIFKEFDKALISGCAVDTEEAKKWFMKKCDNEPNLTVMLNTDIVVPIMDGNTIIGLEVSTRDKNGKTESQSILSRCVIDATADADIAALAGVPYTSGADDYGVYGQIQAVTLVFEVSGVNWKSVGDSIRRNGRANTGVSGNSANGFVEEVADYETVDGNMRFRGPNLARQKNGNVTLNALIIYGVDPLDPDSYAEGMERGIREIPYLVEYMREHFAGFENAEYARHASRLYVRESRHILGEYRLTITDVLENRDHWDAVAYGGYPVDVHASSLTKPGNCMGDPAVYAIPFRCMVPLEIDQLLVTGRSASYDSLPHGSTRVIPLGMATGEACGTAVAYNVINDVTFRQMTRDTEAIEWLQKQIAKHGGYIARYEPLRYEFMDQWSYPGVVVLRELGQLWGGYGNNYKFDEVLEHRWALQNRINAIMRLANERTAHLGALQVPEWSVDLKTDKISVGLLLKTVAECASVYDVELFTDAQTGNAEKEDNKSAEQGSQADQARQGAQDRQAEKIDDAKNTAKEKIAVVPLSFKDAADAREYLIQRGIISVDYLKYYEDLDAAATFAQLYYVLGALYEMLVS